MSSFVGLEIARRGLAAQLKSMEVAGQNIANANSPGYSRQVAVQATVVAGQASSVRYGGQDAGMSGVEIVEMHRHYDAFLTARARELTAQRQEVSTRHDVLARLEELLHEPGEATIGTALENLWASFGQLATNPRSEAARSTVLYQAGTLTRAFGEVTHDVHSLQMEMAERARSAVENVNALTASLAEVNSRIVASSAAVGASAPNALLDARDTLLEELAGLVDIRVIEQAHGEVRVLVAGRSLVEGIGQAEMEMTSVAGQLELSLAGVAVAEVGGSLGGALLSHNTDIPKYVALLGELARDVITQVNTVHAQGYDMDGHPAVDFFTGSCASSMAVAVDGRQMAVSAAADGSDGVVAQRLADLRHSPASAELAPGARYVGLISELGAEAASLGVRRENTQVLTQFAQMRRDSLSGVSLDEELADVMRFQQAYAAAARMLTAIDEALDVLINRTGLVGR